VLLVEDEDQVAGLTQRELAREYGHEVTLAGDPETAARRLGEQTFDVVVVDILFHQLLQDFERRRLARQVTPGSERLLSSGLAVIQLVRKTQPSSKVAIWTTGDMGRRLHLVFAREELDTRVFCSKRSGAGRLDTLNRAIVAAESGRPYIDNILGVYMPARGAATLRQTLLAKPVHRAIWRALSLGEHTNESIAALIGFAPKTVRSASGNMMGELLAFDPGRLPNRKPQPELIQYASANQAFFLDDTVRELYP
jgi:DNA-binding NarL/FixJ family response regulator